MSDPRAFVSFDFDHDEKSKNLFVGQAREDSPTPFIVQDWSSKSSLPQDKWEALIKDKINRCNLVIVLVGRFMASATGVAKEVEMAGDHDVPVFGVYVDGASGQSTLPVGVPRSRTVAWTWDNVGNWIERCMKEGKNNS
jgi:MTH538 TIR-like domain (DUF1863)